VVMILWLIPLITWAVHGTEISFWDVVRTASSPFVSSVVAGGVALGVGLALCQSLSPLVRLVIESTILLTTFLGALMSVATQRSLYLGLLRELLGSLSTKEKAPASA
jgi:hypothetical protein